MYLFNLKVFSFSDSCFKFFENFIAPPLQCSELRLHFKRVSYFQFIVYLQIPSRAGDITKEKFD